MTDNDLEPDAATLRQWLEHFGGYALDHVERLPQMHARGLKPAASRMRAHAVSVPIGEDPLPGGLSAITDKLEAAAEAALLAPGPGYLAYVPGGGLPAAAMADLVGNLLNRYTGLTAAAPALVRLEADVLAWLCRQFGYDENARGMFSSGGSLANLAAIITARCERLPLRVDVRDGAVYLTRQSHHSVEKALRMIGIQVGDVRLVPTDDRFRMRPDALAELIERDRDDGRHPFLVVSSAGTTNTGAIDPLPQITEVCRAAHVWHHVDAAYGGAFVLCERGREKLAGIEEVDSITFDPHKGLFLPYGTGCLLVRRGPALRCAHAGDAVYLNDFDRAPDLAPSPDEHSPELSRPYRGLRLWLPLMLHGAGAFRRALAEKLELTDKLYAGMQQLVADGAPIVIVDEPQLSTIAFRLAARPTDSLEDLDARNEAWLQAINDRGRVFLSSTWLPTPLGPTMTLRACILSFRTHATHIEHLLEDLAQTLPGVSSRHD